MSACDALANLTTALDDLCGADVSLLADAESLQALHRQLDRLEAVTARSAARFDATGAWRDEGARSASAWISARCHQPTPTARRRVRLGRALRPMPEAEARWLDGDIGASHVATLQDARARNPEVFARDEQMLVGHAVRLRFGSWVRAMAYWGQRTNPDAAEDQAQRQHDSRRLHLSATFGGSWRLDGWLDGISGAIVSAEIERIAEELLSADWAEARARRGQDVSAEELGRTPAQRRADALVEMARRSAALPSGSRLPEPLFSVLVGYETFAGPMCELANRRMAERMVVTPGSLVHWLDQAWVERVVFDGPSRVIDVGVRRRIFAGATRRAVQVRDNQCFHPLCDVAAENCQVDHVEPYHSGGLTIQANGRAACGFHNRQRHPPPIRS